MVQDPVPAYDSNDVTIPDDSPLYQPDLGQLTPTFFAAIDADDLTSLDALLTQNPSLVNTRHISRQELPLFYATKIGKPFLVAFLAQRGAPLDDISPTGSYVDASDVRNKIPIMRTALMEAASQGSLPLVKLLFNELKADDKVVAPDGMIALRLASTPEIVALLPTCRRGGWRRFKHSQRKGLRRIKKASYALYRAGRFFVYDVPRVLLWEIPKLFLWDMPKAVLPMIRRTILEAIQFVPQLPGILYQQSKRLAQGAWSVISGLPQFVSSIARAFWTLAKKVPGFFKALVDATWALAKWSCKAFVAFIRGIPAFLAECFDVLLIVLKWTFKLVFKTLPQAMLSTIKFIVQLLKDAARFLVRFVMHLASLVHTVMTAIITRLKNVSLRDIAHAVAIIAVAIPNYIWNTLSTVVTAIRYGVDWTLNQMGDLVHAMVVVIWYIITWIPQKFCQIALGFGEIIMSAAREVVVFINPKSRTLVSR